MNWCECLFRLIWPIVAVLVGLTIGPLLGLASTILVIAITVSRAPLAMLKAMMVTSTTTTEMLIAGQALDPLMRVLVFVVMPIPHLLWIVLSPVWMVFGTMLSIGQVTRNVYQLTFTKGFSKLVANASLKKESIMGTYWQECNSLIYDEDSEGILVLLSVQKALLAFFLFGIPLGIFPAVYFSIVALLITLFRLPINIYTTLRIAYRTVTLKWDLKLCALLLLPLIHLLFPLVVFVTALMGSFGSCICWTTSSIFKSKAPWSKWDKLHLHLQDYYEAHQRFVGEDGILGKYAHPTGIPTGWDGERYGLPIYKILTWQWKFLVSCLLVFCGFWICLVGAVYIHVVKLIPRIWLWWKTLRTEMREQESEQLLLYWVFWVAGFLLIPGTVVFVTIVTIFFSPFMALGIPYTYLHDGCQQGMIAPFKLLNDMDKWQLNLFCSEDEHLRVLVCPFSDCSLGGENGGVQDDTGRERTLSHKKRCKKFNQEYWDRFASQCIETTSSLIQRRWISLDSVQGMDPAVLQIIPAVTLLRILVRTVKSENAVDRGDIAWADGTICKEKGQDLLDDVGVYLMPMVLTIKDLLEVGTIGRWSLWGHQSFQVASESNVKLLEALVCSTDDDTPKELDEFIKSTDTLEHQDIVNAEVRSYLIGFALNILQVKAFQERMASIYKYEYADIYESGKDVSA